LDNSDGRRLSVSLVDVTSGHDAEFQAIATHFEALLIRKDYGRAEMIRDEAHPLRFYAVRYWTDATAAERCHADPEVQALTASLYRIARVTHVVNGVHKSSAMRLMLDDRRARIEADRRTGFDRRVKDVGRAAGERRTRNRRIGPRRVHDPGAEVDLIGAARRAREHADAAFSHFKVGAALEAGDGTIITGCNIENATYGLTLCAERVALVKALSDGHAVFTRVAVVADTDDLTPPCGPCRQLLWEYCGDIEILLANLKGGTARHRLSALLPLPFDARLLG
jgi:cytidine deaminase